MSRYNNKKLVEIAEFFLEGTEKSGLKYGVISWLTKKLLPSRQFVRRIKNILFTKKTVRHVLLVDSRSKHTVVEFLNVYETEPMKLNLWKWTSRSQLWLGKTKRPFS